MSRLFEGQVQGADRGNPVRVAASVYMPRWPS